MNKIEKDVLVFSAGRTGSTFIWQCLKCIFTNVLKAHRQEMLHEYSSYNCPCVVTSRDPVEGFLSRVRVVNYNGDNQLFIDNVNDILSKLPSAIARYAQEVSYVESVADYYKGPVLKLEYEKFVDDYDYIFCQFENFFKIKLTEEEEAKIIEKTCKKTNIKIQSKLEHFGQVDQETWVHGGHIWGKDYKSLLSENNLRNLENKFKK